MNSFVSLHIDIAAKIAEKNSQISLYLTQMMRLHHLPVGIAPNFPLESLVILGRF